MKKIGFIGLGIMGFPMAQHLIDAGYELVLFNRTAAKANPLLEKGAKLAASPAEVARNSEVVIIMVKSDVEVDNIITGENGILSGAGKGFVIVNSSTISPNTSKRLAKIAADAGVTMLDVPVTGSGVQAIEGKLTFMGGGDRTAFDACMPLFLSMGKQAYYMGASGAGSYTKIASNTMLAINLLSMAEGLVMAYKSGIDPELFLQVVNGGGSRSGMAETKIPKITKRDFKPAFGTANLLKDLGLAGDLARELNIPVPVLSVVREQVRMAVCKGYAEEDVCSVIKCYEEWAKVEVKKQ
ncbi:MAG: NAD(P)-dependent oxidoreductase [Negativicutes bacterium]